MSVVPTNTVLEGVWHAWRNHRFAILLASLLSLLAVSPVLLSLGHAAPGLDIVTAFVALAAVISLGFEPHHRLFALLLGLPTAVLALGSHFLSGQIGFWTLTAAQAVAILFLFGAAALIVRSLFTSKVMMFDSILGAVCGYLFVGLGWAVGYTLLEGFQPGSFTFDAAPSTAGSQSLADRLIYYSFITLTTVGYGDVTPVAPAARTLAWLEAIAGQFYLAVIVAGLVSMIVSNKASSQ